MLTCLHFHWSPSWVLNMLAFVLQQADVICFETVKEDLKFSLSEGGISKKTQRFLRIQCCKFCLFSSYNKLLTASHYLYLLVLTVHNVSDKWISPRWMKPSHFSTTIIAFHYITYHVSSGWFLTSISWSWTLSLLVFIVAYFNLHPYHTVQLAHPFLGNIADALGNNPLFLCTLLFSIINLPIFIP